MSVPVFKKPHLKSDRQNKALMHICRNTIGTQSVLHARFYSGLSYDACRKELKVLCDGGFLVQYPLWDNKPLYRIGKRSIRVFGWPRKRSHRLGPARLPYEVGCYALTNMTSVVRKRLLPIELQKVCPEFPHALIHCWAYIWHERVLATVRVEPRCSNPKRIIQKLTEQLYRYCEHKPLESLHQRNQFRFVVVVASEAQESALHLANEHLGDPVPLETAHYPELIRFM